MCPTLIFFCHKQGVCGFNLPPAWRATPKRKDGIHLDGDRAAGSWTGSPSRTTYGPMGPRQCRRHGLMGYIVRPHEMVAEIEKVDAAV